MYKYCKYIIVILLTFICNNIASAQKSPIAYNISKMIPLETTPESLLSGFLYFRSNTKHYVISDNNIICIYSKSGKLHKLLRIKGRGPQESLTLKEFFVDENYLYINNRFVNSLVIYDLNGKYIRTQKFDFPFGEFAVYQGKVIADISNLARSENKRIGIFSLEKGELICREIDMQPSPRYAESGYNQFQILQGKLYYLPYFTDQFFVFNGDRFIADSRYPFHRDELFKANAKRLNSSADHIVAWTTFLQEKQLPSYVKPINSPNYLLINYYIGKERYVSLIHKASKKVITQKVEQQNAPLLYDTPKLVEQNTFVACIPAYLFMKTFGKEGGIQSLDEGDNPVLVLYSITK